MSNLNSYSIKKLGIITSGGDCGGLNAAIYGAAKMALAKNIELVVIPNGYAGLYNLDVITPVLLNSHRIDEIRTVIAGSVAGHSRVKISKINNPKKYEKIKSNLQKHNIDGLIIAGGDETGSVVLDLVEQQIKCIHIPKTMDLDLQTYSVGGDSTIWRIAKFMNDLRTTTQTHNRVLILEVFGRYAGHTAFRGGIGADADCILIPEIGVDFEIVYNHFKQKFTERLQNSDYKATNYSIVVAEGMTGKDGNYFTDEASGTDSFGHQKLGGVGAYVKQILQDFSKKDSEYWKDIYSKNGVYVEGINILPEIRDILPGHLVRCGESTPYDISFGKQCGGSAVQLLLNGISGVTVAGMTEGEIRYIPIKKAIEQRFVDLKDVEFYESLGICFGRTVDKSYTPKFKEITDKIERYM